MLSEGLLTNIKIEKHIDYLGETNLGEAHAFIRDQGGEYIASFPTAISIGIALPNAIVDQLHYRSEKAVRISYRRHAYDYINQRLDLISSEIATLVQQQGYRAYPVPASERYDDKRICSIFSHKLAANLCGFGWIGKNCLLITPDPGPRVRWATVLSDAPTRINNEPLTDRCGSCERCIDICPVKAFTGRAFRPDESREMRYAADKCDAYFTKMEAEGNLRVCGMCLYICPFGMKSEGIPH